MLVGRTSINDDRWSQIGVRIRKDGDSTVPFVHPSFKTPRRESDTRLFSLFTLFIPIHSHGASAPKALRVLKDLDGPVTLSYRPLEEID